LEDQTNENYTGSAAKSSTWVTYGRRILETYIGWSNGLKFCMVNRTGAAIVCGDVVRIEAKFVELASL